MPDCGFNISSLKEHYDDKFKSLEKEADRLAEALKEYKSQANEYRGALKDQSAEFARSSEVKKDFEQMNQQIDLLRDARNVDQGQTAAAAVARANTRWFIVLMVTIILGAIGFYLQTRHSP